MYSVIESYGHRRMRAPDFTEFELPCLVEDEHGIRFLISLDIVLQSDWERAATAGAQGILRVTKDGFSFATREHFVEQRTENPYARAFEMHDRHWLKLDWGLDFPTMIAAWGARHVTGDDPFAQMHTHTEFSAFDGYQTMTELGTRMHELGQKHFAITDHGGCFGHPAAHRMAAEMELHAVYGMETYFVDDRFDRDSDRYAYWHLILWAQDDQGLKNLWGASTEAYRDGLRGTAARLDWDTLARFNSGLLVSTACLGGPLTAPYLAGDEQRALANLSRLGDLFGDRLFIELHTNQLADQLKANQWLVDVAARNSVPLVVAVDSHYARPEKKRDHRAWMAMQTGKDVNAETDLFSGTHGYHLQSIHEVRDALNYLPGDVVEKAIAQTTAVAESCTAEIKPQVVTPVYSKPTAEHPDPVAHDVERFWDAITDGFDRRITQRGLDADPHLAKLEHEAPLLIRKNFTGYFLITAEIVNWAKDNGILVGPARGSGGASECAWLMRITELDPVKGNLLLDRFITEGRKSLPDFDLDFPSHRAEEVITHVQERWGAEHVARVGSHVRIKNKSAFKDVQKAMASELPGESFTWVTQISKLIDQAEASTAGLGLSWDDLMDQVGDLLQPFRERMPELFRLAQEFHLRLKTYGKHAAGFIIDPDHDLEAELPMRRGDENDDGTAPMITQWDMDALEYIGKVKFDLLRLRNLDTIQDTIDLVKAETGRTINPYEWDEEYEDPEVFTQLAEGWTLGVFQIETPLGTQITRRIKPTNRNDLTNTITICRPGPLRSGFDKLYVRRRDGIEAIVHGDDRLEPVLRDTFGVMLYQEDIMAICMTLAGYSPDEADHVRKILGKKKVELVAEEGRKFIARAIANNTNEQFARDLWAQMAEFAKYSFNRAHAYGYATIGTWTAWLKTHYPRQSLVAAMASIKKERIPQFVSEARRLGFEVLPPDINISKKGFASEGLQIRYGFESLPGIAGAGSAAIMEGQPYSSYEDFLERRGKAADMGVVKRLVAIGAFDSLHPNRRALEASVIDITSGEADRCALYDIGFKNKYNELPCHFDWDSEPKNYGRPNPKTGERKLLAKQPIPPTTCRRKACRQYVPKPPADFSHLPNYTAEQIRDREVEVLGVFLSSSPFDVLDPIELGEFSTADDLVVSETGVYPVVAVVINTRPDPKGRDFGFATLLTPSGQMDVILYAKDWALYRPRMNKNTLGMARVIKSADDRYRLDCFDVIVN